MINWVLGGIIAALTIFIIFRTVNKIRKGQSTCCGDCSSNCSHCPSK